MHTFIAWIKRNKLATVLIVLVLLLLLPQVLNQANNRSVSMQTDGGFVGEMAPLGMSKSSIPLPVAMDAHSNYQPVAPAPEVTNRMVVTNSYLSFVVNDVAASIGSVKEYVQSIGGYMVNSDISRPEEGGTGTITVRIPADKLDVALAQLKGQAVKVVSENMEGYDVTDQYVDNAARLVILERNKARFEEIMDRAVKVEDILQVQNEIFNLQSQIDSIKGQQKYLEQTSKMALVTLYLSTDELALPYAPAQAWRPEVIFKLAVRSLMSTLQSLGTLIIWLAVFSIIWLPIVLIILWFIWRKHKKNMSVSTS